MGKRAGLYKKTFPWEVWIRRSYFWPFRNGQASWYEKNQKKFSRDVWVSLTRPCPERKNYLIVFYTLPRPAVSGTEATEEHICFGRHVAHLGKESGSFTTNYGVNVALHV